KIFAGTRGAAAERARTNRSGIRLLGSRRLGQKPSCLKHRTAKSTERSFSCHAAKSLSNIFAAWGNWQRQNRSIYRIIQTRITDELRGSYNCAGNCADSPVSRSL